MMVFDWTAEEKTGETRCLENTVAVMSSLTLNIITAVFNVSQL